MHRHGDRVCDRTSSVTKSRIAPSVYEDDMRRVAFGSPEENAFHASRTAYEEAIERARVARDVAALAAALVRYGSLWIGRGDADRAEAASDEAFALRGHLTDARDEVALLLNVATVHQWRERWPLAAQFHRAASDLAQRHGMREVIGPTLLHLGIALRGAGSLDDAGRAFEDAIAAFRVLSDVRNESIAMHFAGDHDALRGRFAQACERLEAALANARRIAAPDVEAAISLSLGNALWAGGRHGAPAAFEVAAQRFRDAGVRRGEADASCRLAQYLAAAGDVAGARPHFAHAVALYAALPDIRAEALVADLWRTVDPSAPKPRLEVRNAAEVLAPRPQPPTATGPTKPLHRRLADALPEYGLYVAELASRGVLDAREEGGGPSVCESLLAMLDTPRAAGIEPRDAALATLERLYAPETATQIVNVPFADGTWVSTTCVIAARLFVLYEKFPAEFARIAQEVTSPRLAFTITRRFLSEAALKARCRFLDGHFAYRVLGPRVLSTIVTPDRHALERAVLEQDHRKFRWDFEPNRERNSRSVVEVLLQSAFTNLALQGGYDSSYDAGPDGSRGTIPDSYGVQCLDLDIVHRERVPLT